MTTTDHKAKRRNAAAVPKKDEATGTWWFVFDLPPGPDGKRRQARRRGFPTRKAAQMELDALRVSGRMGTFVAPQRLSFATYCDGWLDGIAVAGRRPSTVASYRRNLANHVVPTIGGVHLQALTALHLDRLYATLRTTGSRKTGGPLSARTVRYVHTIISKALSDAERKGLVQRNVATAASPPSAKSAKAPEQAFWSPEELRSFLGFCQNEALFALFRLGRHDGDAARRGVWGDMGARRPGCRRRACAPTAHLRRPRGHLR